MLKRLNIIILAVLLFTGAFGLVNIAEAAVVPAVVAELTNTERASQNLPYLATNPHLNAAAQAKAEDMASKGYFAHTSPEGRTPWYWLDQAGYKYEYAGENLAVNFANSSEVVSGWMASPTHRANIVKGVYTEVGTGVATGFYQGKEAIFVAQVYANPKLITNVKITQTTKKSNVQIKTKVSSPKIVKKSPIKVAKKESTKVLGAEVAVAPVESVAVQEVAALPKNTNKPFLPAFGLSALVLVMGSTTVFKRRIY
jgi:hypothetical protein